jgi:hypothetical protein
VRHYDKLKAAKLLVDLGVDLVQEPKAVTQQKRKTYTPCVVPAAGFISRLGRTGAFNLSICGWFPCGVLLTSLACTMTHDEDAMQVSVEHPSTVTVTATITRFWESPEHGGGSQRGS